MFHNVALSVLALIPRKLKGEEYGKANKASAFNNPVDVKLAGRMKTDKICEAESLIFNSGDCLIPVKLRSLPRWKKGRFA